MPRMLSARRDRPKPPRPHNWQGVDEGVQAMEAALAAGDLQAARAHLRDLLAFAPAEARVWAMAARLFAQEGDIKRAQAAQKRAERLSRSALGRVRIPPAVRLARILWQQGEKEAARAMAAALWMRNPDDARVQALLQELGEQP